MTQLSSGISVEEESPRVRAIEGVPTAILAALGITQRGPHEATLVTSYAEFKRLFGDHIADGYLSLEVQGFFDGGGQAAYIKRAVHYSDITDADSKTSAQADVDIDSESTAATAGSLTGTVVGPFALATGSTLVVTIDGGAPATATFTGTAASRLSTTGTYDLDDGQTLTVSIDGGGVQTVTFATANFADIDAATPAEVAAVINASIVGASAAVDTNAVRITSDRKGTGSSVNVTGGTANTALQFTTGATSGGGNVSDLDAVTVAEVKTIVEAAVAGCTVSDDGGAVKIESDTTGVSSTVLVGASSTADDELGLDNATHTGTTGDAVTCMTVSAKTDGTYGNSLSIEIADATNGDSDDFNLVVEDDGVIAEVWANLSTDPDAARYYETVINDPNTGSYLISVEAVVTDLRPANDTYGPMTGGDDGLTSLSDADFLGNSASETGLHGFNGISDARLLICPDRCTATVHVGMLTYCQTTRKMSMYAVLSPPAGYSVAQIRTYQQTTAGLYNLSEFGDIHYPRFKVANPNRAEFGNTATITVPGCGYVAGTYARGDRVEGGIYKAAAGTERGILVNVLGFENDSMQREDNRDLVYPLRINPCRAIGALCFLDGCRTLKGDGNFPTVPERRGVIYIEQSAKAGLEFARFRNHDEALRAEVDRALNAFLLIQMRQGAFRSKVPSQAFLVDVSTALNTPSVVFQNKLYAAIGLATQKPAEFITLLVSQDTRDIEASLAA